MCIRDRVEDATRYMLPRVPVEDATRYILPRMSQKDSGLWQVPLKRNPVCRRKKNNQVGLFGNITLCDLRFPPSEYEDYTSRKVLILCPLTFGNPHNLEQSGAAKIDLRLYSRS